MNDFNQPPETRFKTLYAQLETHALFQLQTRLAQGTRIQMFIRSSRTMTQKIKNDLAEKNYPSAYSTAVKTTIIFNHIRLRNRENVSPYNLIDQKDLKEVNQALMFSLDVAEKVKPEVERFFRKQYDDFILEQNLQKEREAIEAANRAAQIEQEKKRQEQELKAQQQSMNPIGAWQVPAQAFDPPPRPVLPPAYSREQKPASNITNTSSSKKILIPNSLTATFRKLANSNSAKNIETCGFLFGEKVNPNNGDVTRASFKKQYKITHLLLPRQTGTSDTCNPLDEAEIIMFTSRYSSLVQLGWIHTHPSQTAFLSSVDMHTQFGIQMLMPEAVAIVCSVKYNEDKYLKLSDLGFNEVQKALSGSQSLNSGTFHSYDQAKNMQEDCSGEIAFTDENLQVVDQRS